MREAATRGGAPSAPKARMGSNDLARQRLRRITLSDTHPAISARR